MRSPPHSCFLTVATWAKDDFCLEVSDIIGGLNAIAEPHRRGQIIIVMPDAKQQSGSVEKVSMPFIVDLMNCGQQDAKTNRT
mmetsp:Transcript_16229/g.35137  ORF Transcript_16229/g.35137 Transcript_16229/m.35137 type:complete len:82 (-) Transcript_16229:34-279(-)